MSMRALQPDGVGLFPWPVHDSWKVALLVVAALVGCGGGGEGQPERGEPPLGDPVFAGDYLRTGSCESLICVGSTGLWSIHRKARSTTSGPSFYAA